MTRIDLARASDVASGVPSGVAFPGSPSTDDLFHRTDRDLIYFYDGTRWLTVSQYSSIMGIWDAVGPITASAISHRDGMPMVGTAVWIETVYIVFRVRSGGTALSASHKWVGVWASETGALTQTFTIDSGASNTWRSASSAANALTTASEFALFLTWTKTGTPGSLDVFPRYTYRLVG